MEQFAAEKFFHISSQLAGMAQHYTSGGVRRVSQVDQATLAGQLEDVGTQCSDIGLRVAAQVMYANANQLRNAQFVGLQLGQLLVCVGQAVASEMATTLFMRIFPERAEYYEDQELFGSLVVSNFPSAARDIRSAGSCYAVDRSTACVMHLMRVLELGLNTLAAEFNIEFARENWEKIINDIEAAITLKYEKGKPPADKKGWQKERDFYAAAAKDFRYFKNAWRNHAMHVHEHYEAHEAKSILDHVKAFMQQLAGGGLREKVITVEG
jgi:hypothetical protein